jgi:hypothetical protein
MGMAVGDCGASARRGEGWLDWFTYVPVNRMARETGTASEVRDTFCSRPAVCLMSSCAYVEVGAMRNLHPIFDGDDHPSGVGLGVQFVDRGLLSRPTTHRWCAGDGRSGPPQRYVPLPDQARALHYPISKCLVTSKDGQR